MSNNNETVRAAANANSVPDGTVDQLATEVGLKGIEGELSGSYARTNLLLLKDIRTLLAVLLTPTAVPESSGAQTPVPAASVPQPTTAVSLTAGITPQELTKGANDQYLVPPAYGMIKWQIVGGGVAPTLSINGESYTYFNNVACDSGTLYEFIMQVNPGDTVIFTEAVLHVWFLPGAL